MPWLCSPGFPRSSRKRRRALRGDAEGQLSLAEPRTAPSQAAVGAGAGHPGTSPGPLEDPSPTRVHRDLGEPLPPRKMGLQAAWQPLVASLGLCKALLGLVLSLT